MLLFVYAFYAFVYAFSDRYFYNSLDGASGFVLFLFTSELMFLLLLLLLLLLHELHAA